MVLPNGYRSLLVAMALTATLGPSAALAQGGNRGTIEAVKPFHSMGYDTYTEYHLATAALKAGRFREAEDHFNHVLLMVPTDADSMYGIGLARAGLRDLAGARKAYEQALKAAPQRIDAHRQLAITFVGLGQPERARVELAALQALSDSCAATCSDADALAEAIGAVNAALAPSPGH